MKYYKYQQSFSSGTSEWTFITIPDWVKHKDVGEYLDDCNFLNNDGEHWRGVEWKKVKRLPIREIESEIAISRGQLRWHKENIKNLKEMLATYPEIKGEVIHTEWADWREIHLRGKGIKRWSVITSGKRNPVKLYSSKKSLYSSTGSISAKDWCEKNGYKIVETIYEKILPEKV